MLRVGFCGVGNMSGAVLTSALNSGILSPNQITAFNPTVSKLNAFAGIEIANSNLEVCRKCDVIFLGFKPQKLNEIAPELKGSVDGKCIVSLLAGVSTKKIIDTLGNAYVIRVMPNTPIVVGKGCTAIAKSNAPCDIYKLVCDIFRAAGSVVEVSEDDINKTIPLSSSSPAFFFRFVKAMCDSGVESGLSYDVSKNLVLSTLHGVAHMMESSTKTPDELIAQVTSPGGTTLAGLTGFDDFNFEEMISTVFERTVKRADELGK
ncbi:MAG: pyrroline-5-carboxylate reductase [Clostridia bacterium]|nr:pyrroline-5-carboxylate reductase [Clostridia bacterium]